MFLLLLLYVGEEKNTDDAESEGESLFLQHKINMVIKALRKIP